MDTSRVQTVAETFDPDSRVVRSTQNRNESATTTEAKDGTVSVANELPGANSSNSNQKDASAKNEEIVNYEISKTTRTEMSDGGKLKRMSVAVLVDGTYEKGANGDVAYQPRPQADLDRISALVKSGIGYDAKRGDQIEIVNLRFAAPPESITEPVQSAWYDLSRFDLGKMMELVILGIISLVIALFVGRPLVKAMALPPAPSNSMGLPYGSDVLQIGANPLEQISGLIISNPQASATTVRQWLQDNQ